MCLNRQHQNHDIIEVSAKDLIKTNERLLSDLRMQRNAGAPKEIYFDINKCSSCNINGVSFRGYTFGYLDVFLCENCFAKGWGFFSIGFIRLTKEDVSNIRQGFERIQNYQWDQLRRQNELTLEMKKMNMRKVIKFGNKVC